MFIFAADMQPITRIIHKTLSVRLSLMIVSAMTFLLMVSLFVMLHFSRKTIKEEALQKASQTLECTVERIDNILLSVEQTAGNIYYCLRPDIHQQDQIYSYCRQMVESNPYIVGGAIAFRPNYFKDGKNFMVYYHREINDSIPLAEIPVKQAKLFYSQSYTKQAWFTGTLKSKRPGWMNPLESMNTNMAPMISFCLPMYNEERQSIGVIRVDVSLDFLSKIVVDAKPSVNSYCTLLDGDGSFIVHPNGSRLLRQTAFTMSRHAADPAVRKAVQAMVSGETGYKLFNMDGTNYYVFYKPFTRAVVPGRSMEELSWSAGMVCPEDDVFGDYNNLSYDVFFIAFVGLLVIFLLCRTIIHYQLKPLVLLTESAQRITKGNYGELIPKSRHKDEIARLQDNFRQMQQTLATSIGQLEQLQTTLHDHGENLRKAYTRAQEADCMKTTFLHNMTDQMTSPAVTIGKDVDALCKGAKNRSKLVDDIIENGKTIADLLDNLINTTDEEMRKEVGHD